MLASLLMEGQYEKLSLNVFQECVGILGLTVVEKLLYFHFVLKQNVEGGKSFLTKSLLNNLSFKIKRRSRVSASTRSVFNMSVYDNNWYSKSIKGAENQKITENFR